MSEGSPPEGPAKAEPSPQPTTKESAPVAPSLLPASSHDLLEADKITFRDFLGLLGRLSVPAAASMFGTVVGLLIAASYVGGLVAENRANVAAAQKDREAARLEGDAREAQNEVGYLRDLNEQKVCANFTVRQRALAVRRLRSGVFSVRQELNGRPLPPDGNELPMFTLRFFGIDGVDPMLFLTDEDTLNRAAQLTAEVASLNELLGMIRNYDLTALTNSAQRTRSFKTSYEAHRLTLIANADALIAHLDDRYGAPSVGTGDGGVVQQ